MSDNKENIHPTDQVIKSSNGKDNGKQVATPKVQRIVVLAEEEDKPIQSDSDGKTDSEHEDDDIVEARDPADSGNQGNGDDGEENNTADANKSYAEIVKAPKLFQPAVVEEKKQKNPFKDLQGKLASLPEVIFGIPTAETGSATLGVQLVVFAGMQNMTKQMAEMVKTNNNASGHVQSIKDMLHTITKAEAEGNRVWKNNTEEELKEKLAELKKEHALQQAEQDRQIRELQSLLVAECKAEETGLGGAEGSFPKKVHPASKKGNNKAIKRPSTSKSDEAAAKLPRAEITTAVMSMTPEQRLQAAMAKKQERTKKKSGFTCVLCITNDHSTNGCPRYPTTKDRKIRMIEIGMCLTCGRTHAGTCRFQTSRECDICTHKHLTFLCSATFDV